MKSVEALTGLLGLSVVAGINLYAAILTVGLGLRYGLIRGLPQELEVLGHPAVLTAAGVFYLAEFVADKIPFFSPVWDTVHTVIRPLGAAALAVGATAQLSPLAQVGAAMFAGSVALGTHSTKMGVRLMAHATPEPVSHSALSIAEDFGVVALLVLAYQYPWVALPVLLAILGLMAWLLPILVRVLRFMIAGLLGRITGTFAAAGNSSRAAWAPPEATIRCYGRTGVAPRLVEGYLGGDIFHYRRFWRVRRLDLGQGWQTGAQLQAGLFYDVLEGPSGVSGKDPNSFYLTKDWSRHLAGRLAGQNEKA